MAAWTLPEKITDWCQFLTTTLDRRSRQYFLYRDSGDGAIHLSPEGLQLAARGGSW
jgi:hypothetical protein